MKKVIFILFLILFINACTLQKTLTYPEQQLTFEQQFELKMKSCNALINKQESLHCKDDILLQQAISLDEVTYCDYSSAQETKELCFSLFYLDKAQKNKNNAFCKFIENEVINNICINSVKD